MKEQKREEVKNNTRDKYRTGRRGEGWGRRGSEERGGNGAWGTEARRKRITREGRRNGGKGRRRRK